MRVLPLLVAVALFGTAAPAAAVIFHPGASSLGDALAPGLGNGGYDVRHYDIHLNYQPTTGLLEGVTVITATVTENLSRFDLDFVLPATSVTVNGSAATFVSRNGPPFGENRDLVVTPPHGLRTGSTMTLTVSYSAEPAQVKVDGSSEWRRTPTGVVAWDEPTAAAQWWYPGNDYPSDKATYDTWITAPSAYTSTTNGRLVSRTVQGPDATTHWQSQPLSTHVSILAIGKYTVGHARFGAVPVDLAYENGLGVLTDRARADLSRTPDVLGFLQSQWGPYPFDAAGGIVTGETYPSSLETQTRPVYEAGLWQNNVDNLWVVVHENAHQWFGDSVTFDRWHDIWLAEGFATYSEWVWSQAQREGTAQQLFLATYAEHPAGDTFWREPLNRPDYPLDIIVYQRGAMLLQALRNRVGDADFFMIMRSWAAQHLHANGSTADFEALAGSVSGQDLTSFFDAWVAAPVRPAATADNGFPPDAADAGVRAPASLHAIERSDGELAQAG